MNRCMGCGAVLQSEDEAKIGYIPKEKKGEAKLCLRCFRILHYNDLKMVHLPIENIMETVNRKGKYAFFLMDLLNINEEVVSTYKKITIPKTLIVSKMDYIPKYMKKEKIKTWLREEYGIQEEILFASAVKNRNLSSIEKTMEQENVKSAYLLGYTNSGKSTLLNHLQEKSSITTSPVPNTTLNYIKIPIAEGKELIDSPGFQYQHPLYKEDNLLLIKKMHPKSFLKPLTYQLKKNIGLKIEDVVQIVNESPKCNMTLYISNLLDVEKVYPDNQKLKEYPKRTIEMKKNQDLVILGLGFINVKSDCVLTVSIENLENIEIRNSFFER